MTLAVSLAPTLTPTPTPTPNPNPTPTPEQVEQREDGAALLCLEGEEEAGATEGAPRRRSPVEELTGAGGLAGARLGAAPRLGLGLA